MSEAESRISEQEEVDRLRASLAVAEDRLRRAQTEFQEFTSKVAHDLREPLRTASSYCQLLSARMNVSNDEETALFLRYVLEGVERGQGLLSAIVDYASADFERRKRVAVDLNVVFNESAARAGSKLPQTTFTHDPLPRVMGDFDTLSKILAQLFDNASKFSGRPDVRIHVSAQERDGSWVISVRDNGPGIEPAHQERIFGVFKRLHGREYPGHGLGLAYVRKAVEALDGRIWVESKPGDGSTFYFSLPPVE